MSLNINYIKKIFKNKSATIGVIGLGYVGLPLIMAFIHKNFHVYGFDIDKKKIRDLKNGVSYINQISSKEIKRHTLSKKFEPTNDFSKISLVDVILICVPTPLDKYKKPDLSYIISTGNLILPFIKKNQLIVLESTTYPGTCQEILKPILERNGLKSGKNIFLAYSPEREDPGNADFATSSIPKIIGGHCPDSLALAEAMYNQVIKSIVPVKTMKTAEAVKITENVFRESYVSTIGVDVKNHVFKVKGKLVKLQICK